MPKYLFLQNVHDLQIYIVNLVYNIQIYSLSEHEQTSEKRMFAQAIKYTVKRQLKQETPFYEGFYSTTTLNKLT